MLENNLKGTVLYSGIVPTNTSDVYPTHSAIYGMGGYRSVKTIAERDAIPVKRLEVGAKVLVSEQKTGYYVESIVDGKVNWQLDTYLFADKLLASPVISGTWSFKNNAGTKVTNTEVGVSNVNASSITIERGYKAKFVGSFKWTKTTTNKAPTSCSGDLGTTLPSSDVASPTTTIDNIAASRVIKETLSAPKKGFMVSGSSVVVASGNDTTSAQFSINVWSRQRYGVTTSATPTQDDIKAMTGTKLVNARTLSVSGVTADGTQYYSYAYPKDLGALTSIVQNGAASVLEDFNRTEVTVTNGAGVNIVYYVYTSKYKGAFQNVKLDFK
jgi:hypothetical protein